MALQVRSVSEPTYEEDGVNYGTPTNMIEKIKELQLKIEDTEAFRSLSDAQSADDKPAATAERSPVVEAIRKYPKRIMLAAGAFLSVQVTFYILIAFVIAYGMN